MVKATSLVKYFQHAAIAKTLIGLVDQILAQENLATGDVDWLLADHQGTIRDVVRWDDANSETDYVQQYQYDTFGNLVLVAGISGSVISTDRSTAVTRYQYTGRDWDADSGLQYNRMRWYDPAIGRWISEDPIGFAGGDANLSRYVGNSPLTSMDPLGLCEKQLVDEKDIRIWFLEQQVLIRDDIINAVLALLEAFRDYLIPGSSIGDNAEGKVATYVLSKIKYGGDEAAFIISIGQDDLGDGHLEDAKDFSRIQQRILERARTEARAIAPKVMLRKGLEAGSHRSRRRRGVCSSRRPFRSCCFSTG